MMEKLTQVFNKHAPNYIIGTAILTVLLGVGLLDPYQFKMILLGFNGGFFITLWIKEFSE